MDSGEPRTPPAGTGRANQKLRTRNAIVRAAVDLMRTGRDITMLEVAKAALVSEATAYRYFPDLASLLREAMDGQMPAPAEAVERVAAATEHLLRLVHSYQGATRAMIAATITRPATASTRPGLRFGLIDHALAPLEHTLGADDPAALAQLKRDLAVVVSAEAFFCLTDMCHLSAQDAIASVVHTATALTRAAVRA
jgi:AcrR family transcriptional regulator